jgi:hypothetical protein
MDKPIKWTKNVVKDGVILHQGENSFSGFHNLDCWVMKLCCNGVNSYMVRRTVYLCLQG